MTQKFLTGFNITHNHKGFVVYFVAILVLVAMIGIALSITILTMNEYTISSNIVKSSQTYFAAEAGTEDALLRLSKAKNWSSPYSLNVGNGSTTVVISNIIGGSRTIMATGNVLNRIRKVQVAYQISSDVVSFHYGVQAGDLGLQMKSNAVVYGNIFSNGPITGESNTKIYGDAISAGESGRIESINIKSTAGEGGNAWATIIAGGNKCAIDGDAHYTASIDCDTVGGEILQEDNSVEPQVMPINVSQITEWKDQAAAGGTTTSYSLGGNNQASLGPKKVEGNMTLDSNAQLTVTGTIWVTGNLSLNSNVVVQLAPGYGSLSGVIVVDGQISVGSNVTLCGSEGYKSAQKCNPSVGSYLMLLSTKASTDPNNPAIAATSNTKTAILYASAGFIKLDSNAKLREATGYGIYMGSNAEVTYETGLANALFSSGPGGSWKVTSWKEIE